MRNQLHKMAVLMAKYYCFYCNKSYPTTDQRNACVDRCYQKLYGGK